MKRSSSFALMAVLAVIVLGLTRDLPGREEGAAGREDPAALVEQLGAEGFADREAASRGLWELGLAAMPALRTARGSEDPEVRVRARRIMEDLELGIFVDTPPETVALLREFHSGGLKQKQAVLQRLRGDDQVLARVRLMLTEKNVEWRNQFVREFGGTGDKLLEALREAGQMQVAEELLAVLSPRSWAVHLILEGTAGARLEALGADAANGDAADPEQLCWLLLLTDQLEKAQIVAEQSGRDGLRREVYLRQLDWKAFLDVAGGEIGSNPVENAGLSAWFLTKAGEQDDAQEAVDQLLAMDLEAGRMVENRTASLLILGRFDQGAEAFADHGPLDANEFKFHLDRMDFEALAARLGVNLTAGAIGAEVRRRAAEVMEDPVADGAGNTRREVFTLARAAGEFLVHVGETGEAREVFLSARELVRREAPYLSYLARTCRAAGFLEEAEAMELELLRLGGKTYSLGARFPQDRAMAQLWWDFLRSKHPDEEQSERLDRIAGLLKPGPEGKEDVDGLMVEAIGWVEQRHEDQRAKNYGALAEHYQGVEDWDAAARYFRKQSELSKTPATSLMEAGDMFAGEARWAEAEEFYREAVEADGRNELALYLRGRALREAGRNEEGEACQATALQMPLANSNRRSRFASGLQRRGLHEEAREQWEFLLETAAHDNWDGTDFWTLRSTRMQLVNGLTSENPALAADHLESYMMSFLKTNTSTTPASHLGYHARIELLRFEACMAKGNIEDAVDHLRRGIRARPGSSATIIRAVEQLAAAGRQELAHEIHALLAERFAAAVERFPKAAAYHATLADLSFRMGDREAAIASARRCVELDPDSATYRSELERFTAEDGKTTDP